jgi:DNA-binding transcriptional regulator YiaG
MMPENARAALESKAAAQTIVWARTALGLSYAELAGATGASERTVIRWAQQRHPPRQQHRNRIEKLNVLRQLLAATFGEGTTTVQEWSHEPLARLGGRTPLSLLIRGDVDQVIGVLAGLESGAFN